MPLSSTPQKSRLRARVGWALVRLTLVWAALTAILVGLGRWLSAHPIAADAATVGDAVGLTRGHTGWRSAWVFIEGITYPAVLIATLAILASVVAVRSPSPRQRWRASWVVPVAVLTWILSARIKLWVDRPRPSIAEPIWQAAGLSFPSGHATGAAITAGLAVYLLWGSAARTWQRAALLVGALGLVLLVGIDRLMLGVHYPSDILAGWALGGLSALAAAWASERAQPVLATSARSRPGGS